MSRSLRAPVLLATAALAALGLAGCTPTGDDDPSASPSASRSGSASGSASPSASATASPLEVACGDLVSAQTVYDWNPNFVLLDAPDIPAGSAAARAQSAGGTACAWQNTSSSEVVYVSVARYDAAARSTLAASAGDTTTAFSAPQGWFSSSGGTGTASAESGDVWVVASSTAFFEAGDATVFVDSAVAAVS